MKVLGQERVVQRKVPREVIGNRLSMRFYACDPGNGKAKQVLHSSCVLGHIIWRDGVYHFAFKLVARGDDIVNVRLQSRSDNGDIAIYGLVEQRKIDVGGVKIRLYFNEQIGKASSRERL